MLFGQLHIPQAAFLVVKIPQSTMCPHRVFAVNSAFRDKSAVSERPTLFTAPTNKRLHPQREEERSYYSTLTWRMQLMEYKHFTDLGFAKSTFKIGHLWRRWDVWIEWRKFESSQVSFIMETASQQLAPTYFLLCWAVKKTSQQNARTHCATPKSEVRGHQSLIKMLQLSVFQGKGRQRIHSSLQHFGIR